MAALTGLGGEIDGREELWRDIPGQQLFNTIDRVIGNTSKHLAQIRFRVQSAEFGCADQAVESGSALAAGIGSSE